jgi:hypothetical protein
MNESDIAEKELLETNTDSDNVSDKEINGIEVKLADDSEKKSVVKIILDPDPVLWIFKTTPSFLAICYAALLDGKKDYTIKEVLSNKNIMDNLRETLIQCCLKSIENDIDLWIENFRKQKIDDECRRIEFVEQHHSYNDILVFDFIFNTHDYNSLK